MKKLKQTLSTLLAAALMCGLLCVPASAATGDGIIEITDNEQVTPVIGLDPVLSGIYRIDDSAFFDEWTNDRCNYAKPDYQMTITNKSTDPNLYLVIFYRAYKYITEPLTAGESEKVYLQGKYYSEGNYLLRKTIQNDYSVNYLKDIWPENIPTLDNRYWCRTEILLPTYEEKDDALLAPGESVTVAVPNDGTDTIYQLIVQVMDPINDPYWEEDHGGISRTIKYGEPPIQSETPTETTEPTEPAETTEPTEPAETTKPAEPASAAYKVTAKKGVNVRSGPGTNYKKAAPALRYGTEVQILETKGQWGKLADGKGWLYLPALKAVAAPAKPAQPEQPAAAKTVVDTRSNLKLNVRTGPGTNYKIAGPSLKNGTEIQIVETKGQWGKLANDAGWVYLPATKTVK